MLKVYCKSSSPQAQAVQQDIETRARPVSQSETVRVEFMHRGFNMHFAVFLTEFIHSPYINACIVVSKIPTDIVAHMFFKYKGCCEQATAMCAQLLRCAYDSDVKVSCTVIALVSVT